MSIEEKMMSLDDVARKHAEDLKRVAAESDRADFERSRSCSWDQVRRWADSLGGVKITSFQFQGERHRERATFTAEGRHFALEYDGHPYSCLLYTSPSPR